MTTTVTKALSGLANAGEPSGTCLSISKMMGITVTGISMITVPATAGVRIRRSSDRWDDRMNWKNDDTSTRVASIAGPPWTSAVTQTAIKAPEVPMRRTWPAPKRPTRTACSTVVTPLTATAANTAHERKASLPPAARITMAGVNTTPAMQRMASCRPSPMVSASGGFSSGW